MGSQATCCTRRERQEEGASTPNGSPRRPSDAKKSPRRSPEEPAHGTSSWKVAAQTGNLNVHRRPSLDTEVVGTKQQGEIVEGVQEGDWVRTSDGLGFVTVRSGDAVMLESCSSKEGMLEAQAGNGCKMARRDSGKGAGQLQTPLLSESSQDEANGKETALKASYKKSDSHLVYSGKGQVPRVIALLGLLGIAVAMVSAVCMDHHAASLPVRTGNASVAVQTGNTSVSVQTGNHSELVGKQVLPVPEQSVNESALVDVETSNLSSHTDGDAPRSLHKPVSSYINGAEMLQEWAAGVRQASDDDEPILT